MSIAITRSLAASGQRYEKTKTHLFTLGNKRNDHPKGKAHQGPLPTTSNGHIPVEIIKEREQVKPELNEALFLVSGEGAKDLCCIVHVVFVSYPQEHKTGQIEILGMRNNMSYLLTLYASSGALRRNAVHCPERRKSVVKKAWAIFSGRTN
jgi:hypothetical protein